ncbi:multidrug transporter [Marinobacter koreensis]|uniref:multidrug transporter n=1 Tax=Marinobacter koreensis TaxID=335974 RepID=UPI003608509A
MSYDLAAIVLIVIGAVLVIASLIFFLRPRWLLGWLKGMAVFGALVLGIYTLSIAVSLTGYQSLEGMQTVASISTTRQGEQLWRVTVERKNEAPITEAVHGDQWQMDARILRFSGPIRWLGIAPGYRLERLSGRYTSLEQERTEPRTVIGLSGGDGRTSGHWIASSTCLLSRGFTVMRRSCRCATARSLTSGCLHRDLLPCR